MEVCATRRTLVIGAARILANEFRLVRKPQSAHKVRTEAWTSRSVSTTGCSSSGSLVRSSGSLRDCTWKTWKLDSSGTSYGQLCHTTNFGVNIGYQFVSNCSESLTGRPPTRRVITWIVNNYCADFDLATKSCVEEYLCSSASYPQ